MTIPPLGAATAHAARGVLLGDGREALVGAHRLAVDAANCGLASHIGEQLFNVNGLGQGNGEALNAATAGRAVPDFPPARAGGEGGGGRRGKSRGVGFAKGEKRRESHCRGRRGEAQC